MKTGSPDYGIDVAAHTGHAIHGGHANADINGGAAALGAPVFTLPPAQTAAVKGKKSAITPALIDHWKTIQLANRLKDKPLTTHGLYKQIYSDKNHPLYNVHTSVLTKHAVRMPAGSRTRAATHDVFVTRPEHVASLNILFSLHEGDAARHSSLFYLKEIQAPDTLFGNLADMTLEVIGRRLKEYRKRQETQHASGQGGDADSASSMDIDEFVASIDDFDEDTSAEGAASSSMSLQRRRPAAYMRVTNAAVERLKAIVIAETDKAPMLKNDVIRIAQEAEPEVFGRMTMRALLTHLRKMDPGRFIPKEAEETLSAPQQDYWTKLQLANLSGQRLSTPELHELIYSNPDDPLYEVSPSALAAHQLNSEDAVAVAGAFRGHKTPPRADQLSGLKELFAANELVQHSKQPLSYYKAIYAPGSTLAGLKPVTIAMIRRLRLEFRAEVVFQREPGQAPRPGASSSSSSAPKPGAAQSSSQWTLPSQQAAPSSHYVHLDPTFEPTFVPTLAPALVPAFVPTFDRALVPAFEPTIDSLFDTPLDMPLDLLPNPQPDADFDSWFNNEASSTPNLTTLSDLFNAEPSRWTTVADTSRDLASINHREAFPADPHFHEPHFQ